MTVITLLTDFGLKDSYVAQMKGVILNIHPEAKLVDISHAVERHNIAMGSFILETTVPFFSGHTIHLAVVDPGVGSRRLPIVVDCGRSVLVGPDNGLLARASEKLGFRAAYQIQNEQFKREVVSSTFHGRDIFAHTAGRIGAGYKPKEVGPKVSEIVKLELPKIAMSKTGLTCSVLYIDAFGSIITNVEEDDLAQLGIRQGQPVKILTNSSEHKGRFVKSYSDVERGQVAVLWGSQGYLEIARVEADAAHGLKVKPLDRIELLFK